MGEATLHRINLEIIRWLGNDDPTTRNLIEDILKKEEEHADDFSNMLENFDPEKAPTQVKTAELNSSLESGITRSARWT